MNLLSFFRRNPGRELALQGHRQYRQRVRGQVDRMRRDMGMKPVRWPR